jgi:hypothetical protein
MGSVFASARWMLIVATEMFVVGSLGAALVAGLYQIVRDRVRESRLLDQVTPEIKPIHKQA